ncbi:MAG TPA: zf-HC2 domain-containing protein, partial [Gemmatimonadaceae bacterium]|nr:zf-HC2 domain-containing protein [Gemmatimonadaceae bacterium]
MTDCPNAEMRDRLPDLLHERLDASARAVVMAHVDGCDDCRAELMLLREASVALTSDVRGVDITSITRVVIGLTAGAQEPTRRRARSPWMDWRVAASIAVLAVGGASFAVVRARQQPVAAAVPAAVSHSVPAPVSEQ